MNLEQKNVQCPLLAPCPFFINQMRGPSVRFTKHALERVAQRGLQKSLIYDTLESPTCRKPLNTGTIRYVRDTICVIVTHDSRNDSVKVVTCFRVRRGRYSTHQMLHWSSMYFLTSTNSTTLIES